MGVHAFGKAATMTAACIGLQELSEELNDVMDAMHMSYFPDAALAWGMLESTVGVVMVAGYLPTICGGACAGTVCQMFT